MEREISNDGTIVEKMSGGCRRREWPSKNAEITKVDSLRVSTLQILQNIRKFSNFISRLNIATIKLVIIIIIIVKMRHQGRIHFQYLSKIRTEYRSLIKSVHDNFHENKLEPMVIT